MRTGAKSVILDLLHEKLVGENDIIFIKNRKQTSTPILKRQRRPLSTGGGKEKKKPKISTPSSSEKESDKKSKDKKKQ